MFRPQGLMITTVCNPNITEATMKRLFWLLAGLFIVIMLFLLCCNLAYNFRSEEKTKEHQVLVSTD